MENIDEIISTRRLYYRTNRLAWFIPLQHFYTFAAQVRPLVLSQYVTLYEERARKHLFRRSNFFRRIMQLSQLFSRSLIETSSILGRKGIVPKLPDFSDLLVTGEAMESNS